MLTKLGCTSVSECVSVVSTTIDNNNSNISDISVFPNPTSGKVHVELPKDYIGSKVHLLDMTGNLLNSYLVEENKLDFDIEGYNGVYFIKINTPDNLEKIFKIIKH